MKKFVYAFLFYSIMSSCFVYSMGSFPLNKPKMSKEERAAKIDELKKMIDLERARQEELDALECFLNGPIEKEN